MSNKTKDNETLQPTHIEAETRDELDVRINEVILSAPEDCTVTAIPLYDPWKPCFYCDITYSKP